MLKFSNLCLLILSLLTLDANADCDEPLFFNLEANLPVKTHRGFTSPDLEQIQSWSFNEIFFDTPSQYDFPKSGTQLAKLTICETSPNKFELLELSLKILVHERPTPNPFSWSENIYEGQMAVDSKWVVKGLGPAILDNNYSDLLIRPSSEIKDTILLTRSNLPSKNLLVTPIIAGTSQNENFIFVGLAALKPSQSQGEKWGATDNSSFNIGQLKFGTPGTHQCIGSTQSRSLTFDGSLNLDITLCVVNFGCGAGSCSRYDVLDISLKDLYLPASSGFKSAEKSKLDELVKIQITHHNVLDAAVITLDQGTYEFNPQKQGIKIRYPDGNTRIILSHGWFEIVF